MTYQTSRAVLLAGLLLSLAACSGSSNQASNPDPIENGTPERDPVEDPAPEPEPEPTPLPRVTLDSAASSVTSGSSTTLSWTSTNVDSCQASGGWSGNRPISGSEPTPALTEPTTFTLSCSGPGGSINRSISVAILAAGQQPDVTLNASSTLVDAGESVQLNWSSSNADSCSAEGAWSGDVATEGNRVVGPLTSNSTFTVTCSNSQGSAVAMVAVSVTGQLSLSWVAPTENVDGTPLTDLAGYRIYYGERSRDYGDQEAVNDPNTTSVAISVPSGDYYVAMTAIDAEGNESGYSNEVVKSTN